MNTKMGSFATVQHRLIAGFLFTSVIVSQTAFAASPQGAAPQRQTMPSSQTISVPAAIVIPLTLISQIKSKSTKVGDTVRAQVAFPITVGTQMAIPSGTFVEGVVTLLTARAKKTHQPDLQIHFTRLLYANGYVASLDAVNSQARNELPASALPAIAGNTSGVARSGAAGTRMAFYGGEGFASPAQTGTQPTPQSLPSVGPSKAVVFGAVAGAAAAIVILGIAFRHHSGNADYLLFDSGWQFQMTINTPLAVDAGQVAAAAATPSH